MLQKDKRYTLWFKEIDYGDLLLVGGKNCSLGEMYRALKKKRIAVPNGFAITTYAYKKVLEQTGVGEKLSALLAKVDAKNVEKLAEISRLARDLIMHCELPPDLVHEISLAYKKLSKSYGMAAADVAVRSSATSEDLPEASFAGQMETFLNVRSMHELFDAVKACWASLFTARAIAYREEHGIAHDRVAISVGVQKMVRSDLGSAGVAFTLDTETGFRNVVFITGSWGLGEAVVAGQVNPDEFYVFKPTLAKGYKPLLMRRLGDKLFKIVYAEGRHATKRVDTTLDERKRFCLTEDEVLQLAKWAIAIEEHYTKLRKKPTPMDIEWAKDGISGQLAIVQARPETVQAIKPVDEYEEYSLEKKGKVLTQGLSVGAKIASGRAHVLKELRQAWRFKPGEILVTGMTDPDWVPVMRLAAGIVTDRGGRTCHAAIVSRELGIPCIVGTRNATQLLKTGQPITISCAEGDIGKVYDGLLPFKKRIIKLKEIPKTKTALLLNIGNPEEAFEQSFLPNDGVGLARMEFIVSEYIKVHPLALIYPERLDPETAEKIEELTSGYKSKEDFYIDKLAEGIGMLAAAFWPKPVTLRLTDFKSNEYANLLGGQVFEPKEENPMLGWRGASRYYSPEYLPAFALECAAIRKVRDVFGLKNLKLLIPMCRTPEEGKRVLKKMEKFGLVRGKDGLEVYVMAEIPSNILLAEEFCKIFDGFSIGSNDLTQLVLGIDRDNELVAGLFDERNAAVKALIKQLIEVAHAHGKKVSICGDAPSTIPEFNRFLVECGIDSISLSPDAAVKMRYLIAQFEKEIGR